MNFTLEKIKFWTYFEIIFIEKYLKFKEIEYLIHYVKFKMRPVGNSSHIPEILSLEQVIQASFYLIYLKYSYIIDR